MDKNPGVPKPETTASAGGASATKKAAPKVQSTALFRALNPELFMKPNPIVMGIGLVTASLCVAYIAYMNATAENRKTYMALNEDGSFTKRTKSSRWD